MSRWEIIRRSSKSASWRGVEVTPPLPCCSDLRHSAVYREVICQSISPMLGSNFICELDVPDVPPYPVQKNKKASHFLGEFFDVTIQLLARMQYANTNTLTQTFSRINSTVSDEIRTMSMPPSPPPPPTTTTPAHKNDIFGEYGSKALSAHTLRHHFYYYHESASICHIQWESFHWKWFRFVSVKSSALILHTEIFMRNCGHFRRTISKGEMCVDDGREKCRYTSNTTYSDWFWPVRAAERK